MPLAEKKSKPKRELKKVLASVKQVMRVHHVSEPEAIWTWGEAQNDSLPPRFRLCVWNLWKQAGGKLFEAEFKGLAPVSDLFLSQEALVSREAISLFAQPGFGVVHAATYRRLDGRRDGVMTLCRARLALPARRIVSATVEPLLKTTKAALLTHYKIGDNGEQLLAVVNLHSTLIRSPKTAKLEIIRIIEHLEHHDGPVVFAGDFNTFSMAYFREMAEALKMIGILHVRPTNDPRTRLAQLDQLFIRGLKIRSFKISVDIVHSDHFPIVCDVELDA